MPEHQVPRLTPLPEDALEAVAEALIQHYRRVYETRFQGLPIANPLLPVEVVGVRATDAFYLGSLLTPWMINQVVIPRRLDPETVQVKRAAEVEPGRGAPTDEYRLVVRGPHGSKVVRIYQADGIGIYGAASPPTPPMESYTSAEQARAEASRWAVALWEELYVPRMPTADALPVDASDPDQARPEEQARGEITRRELIRLRR